MLTRKPCYDPFGFNHNDMSEIAEAIKKESVLPDTEYKFYADCFRPATKIYWDGNSLRFNSDLAVAASNETTISKNTEDNKMKGNELVKIWYDKNEKELEAEYGKKIVDLKETDPAKMAVDDLVKAANKVMDTYELAPISVYERLTKETRVEIDKLRIEESEKRDALMQKRLLVESQLDMCDCYEQRREVLIAYGILNEKGIMV